MKFFFTLWMFSVTPSSSVLYSRVLSPSVSDLQRGKTSTYFTFIHAFVHKRVVRTIPAVYLTFVCWVGGPQECRTNVPQLKRLMTMDSPTVFAVFKFMRCLYFRWSLQLHTAKTTRFSHGEFIILNATKFIITVSSVKGSRGSSKVHTFTTMHTSSRGVQVYPNACSVIYFTLL